ncbi:MAG: 4'-phosphopantetheinyl transferase superfamily protein [Bacteroidetes bacterium]|nr:4'-phosphopantetheinyl transferase superfamily protein [Bacteroidota bacterium]
MLGNDIVDMEDGRNLNRSGQKRFLDKLFTPSEQQLISASDMPDHMIWVLWSIKESAYKVVNRSTGIRSYVPLSYKVQLSSALLKSKMINRENSSGVKFLDSSISALGFKLFAKTLVTRNFIYSHASSEFSYLKHVKWNIEKTTATKPEQQSHTIRESAKKHIAQTQRIEMSEISISNDEGRPPCVQINHKSINKIDLSFTHDGPYLAYSYILRS